MFIPIRNELEVAVRHIASIELKDGDDRALCVVCICASVACMHVLQNAGPGSLQASGKACFESR